MNAKIKRSSTEVTSFSCYQHKLALWSLKYTKSKTFGLSSVIPPPNQSEGDHRSSSQQPHPLFSCLIPKELINMHEVAISIGTKAGACTSALWRSIRNTEGPHRGKLSVSSALGSVNAHTHIKKEKVSSKLTAYTPHPGRRKAQKPTNIFQAPVTVYRLPFFTHFPVFWADFVMSSKIGPFHLLSLKCHYLGLRGRGPHCHCNIFVPLKQGY